MQRLLWSVFLLAALPALPQSSPAPAAPPAPVARKPLFVTLTPEQFASLIPAAPANDSWRTVADVAEMLRVQETRTPQQIAHAQADDTQEDLFVFADVLGAKFNQEALPKAALLSAHLRNEEGVVVGPVKRINKRPRPHQFDARIKPVCKATSNPTDYAYPSGHTTTGYLAAITLAMIVPEKKDAIFARAEDYGHSRVVCGVHYPSDAPASKAIAYAMVANMLSHPQFQRELAEAKAEIRAALGY